MQLRLEARQRAAAALVKMVEDDLEGFAVDLTDYASADDPDINRVRRHGAGCSSSQGSGSLVPRANMPPYRTPLPPRTAA